MLDERFLTRLSQAFPTFHDRVDAEAKAEAQRLLAQSGGDVQRALVRARFEGAARLWWPYVKGSVPVVGDDRGAMEAFTRIVLAVDHVLGHQPPSMEAAREQVIQVLRSSLDVERLSKLAGGEGPQAGKGGAAAAGLVASVAALWAPVSAARRVARAARWLPRPVKYGVGALVLATLASIPIVAGFSAGRQAERAARSRGIPPTLEAPDGSRSYHDVAA